MFVGKAKSQPVMVTARDTVGIFDGLGSDEGAIISMSFASTPNIATLSNLLVPPPLPT